MTQTRAPTEPSRAWQGPLFLAASLGLAAGLTAVGTEGLVRRLGLFALLLAGLLQARVVSSRRVPAESGGPLGGSGYRPPENKWVRALHAVLSLAHNGGIMVVVFAALVRFRVIPLQLPDTVLQFFPLFLGVYLVLLAVAVKQRIDERGGVIRAWYTRLHGWFLAALALPIAGLAIGLLFRSQVSFFGAFEVTEPDLQVLVLAGILGVGTQMFLAVQLPTLFDLVSDIVRLVVEPREGGRGTPPIVYAGLLSLGATAVLGFVLFRLDVVRSLGGFHDERVGLLLVLLPVGLALFLLTSALQIWREGRRGLYSPRITANVRQDLLVYGFSAVAGLGFTILLVLNLLGRLESIGPFQGGRDMSKDLIVFTILVTAGPIGWHLSRRSRAIDAIENRLPDFLNDLAETRRAGLTLAASLQSCSLSDYGALTPEIRKMANQVSWGVPFTEALDQFAQRVKTNLVRRSVHLIIEASRTGGSVADILKAAAKDAYEIKALESERRVNMMTYLIVLYVVYFVFLTVMAVLDAKFIPEVIEANQASARLGGEIGADPLASGKVPIGGGKLDQDVMRFAFFNAAIVQAIGNGVVSGVLTEGRVSSGFRHVAIMAFTAWMLFRFLIV
jgi:archaeal flagellar protein FlaJ